MSSVGLLKFVIVETPLKYLSSIGPPHVRMPDSPTCQRPNPEIVSPSGILQKNTGEIHQSANKKGTINRRLKPDQWATQIHVKAPLPPGFQWQYLGLAKRSNQKQETKILQGIRTVALVYAKWQFCGTRWLSAKTSMKGSVTQQSATRFVDDCAYRNK